jgi:hypothetical protein
MHVVPHEAMVMQLLQGGPPARRDALGRCAGADLAGALGISIGGNALVRRTTVTAAPRSGPLLDFIPFANYPKELQKNDSYNPNPYTSKQKK